MHDNQNASGPQEGRARVKITIVLGTGKRIALTPGELDQLRQALLGDALLPDRYSAPPVPGGCWSGVYPPGVRGPAPASPTPTSPTERRKP